MSDRSPPTSPRRVNSINAGHHIPAHPSRLRESTAVSPLDTISGSYIDADEGYGPHDESPPPSFLNPESSRPLTAEPERLSEAISNEAEGEIAESSRQDSDERTALLESYSHHHHSRVCGLKNCNHGTFSPRAPSLMSTLSFANTDLRPSFLRGHTRNASYVEATHGIKSTRLAYFSYYFPFLRWARQYQWKWFRGDLAAALTMASFYIPMSLSYAANLGHIPPINGLYAFVFNPLIYAFLGSCPQMVVGPEAPGSLLVGTVVATCIDKGQSGDDDGVLNAQIAGVVTAMAGLMIFVAGLTRLGFIESVLSRPFLRGFISAIGFVILVDQAIPELGFDRGKAAHRVQHQSSIFKLVYMVQHIKDAHLLTSIVSITSFTIIMFFRTLKRNLQPRYPSVAYFPDRFIVVVLSAIFAWQFNWDERGLELLGDVKPGDGVGIPFHWPFQFRHMQHIDTALSTALLIALLGFFESSVAAKSLGEGDSGLKGVTISANRELIALGTANVIGGCFMSLPAFGGYGRSKVNASTGGTTPMSSLLLSIISLLSAIFLLPYFYYLPKAVLSAMISVVAYSLIEECPHDIKFFIRIRGWTELALMAIIFLATVFYSLSVGIALGMGLSLLSLVKHATKPRIQILGRVPGSPNTFENAESSGEPIEFVEGCLIVKIPEPLTFANTGQLKNRLRRLEQYGTNQAHPSLPRVRHAEHNKNIIFDVHGVTSIDGSGTQVFAEIVEGYVKQGVRVIFCRLPSRRSDVFEAFERSGIVEICGGPHHFVGSVDEALKLSEAEDIGAYFNDRVNGHINGHG